MYTLQKAKITTLYQYKVIILLYIILNKAILLRVYENQSSKFSFELLRKV